MRRRNREINIFSMSALDLFAAAMGAFMLIALICLPYYRTTDQPLRDEIERLENTVAELNETIAANEGDIKRIQEELEKAKKQLAQCKQSLSKTYLVVIMKWAAQGKVDIDLHVTDASGNEFYYKAHNRRAAGGRRPHFPSTDAELSIDMLTGPGIEVWESFLAKPGTYTVAYKYYSGTPSPVEVTGSILHGSGSRAIAPTRLTPGQKKTVATIVVGANGNVTIR